MASDCDFGCVSTTPQRAEEELDFTLRRLEAGMDENSGVGIFHPTASQEFRTSQQTTLEEDSHTELDNVRNNYAEYEQKNAELFRRLQHERRMTQRQYQVVDAAAALLEELNETQARKYERLLHRVLMSARLELDHMRNSCAHSQEKQRQLSRRLTRDRNRRLQQYQTFREQSYRILELQERLESREQLFSSRVTYFTIWLFILLNFLYMLMTRSDLL